MVKKVSKIEEMLKNEKVEWKKLGDVFEIRNGYTPSKQNKDFWENGNIPWFRMDDIRDSGRILKDSKQHITEKAIKGKGLFKSGSIILATTATIGEHAMLIADSLANQQFTNFEICKSLKEYILPKYVFHYFDIIDEWCKNNVKVSSFPAVNMDKLMQIMFPIPSIKTQEKIVKTLDKFTEYVTELQAELQAELQYRTNQYEYYRNMLLSEEYLNKLSKKLLDVSGGENRLYCSNLEYMRELIEVKLETIVKIKNGKDWKKLDKGNIPVYGSGGNMDIYVDKYSYNKPSVLIPRKGSIENVFYLEEPFWNVDTIFYTEIDESKIIPRYLYYFISNYDIKLLSTDSTRPSLTQEALNRIVVQLPPLSLQNKIVEILDKFQAILSESKGLLPKEIEERQKQYEYYREKLLTFDVESGKQASKLASKQASNC